MTAHTPGPWVAHTDMDGRHLSYSIMANGAEFQDNETQPYHPLIAHANHSKGRAPVEVAKANARLIAAAPDLLEAVQTWMKFFDTMPKGQFGKISCDIGLMNDGFVKSARALSKATRGQS